MNDLPNAAQAQKLAKEAAAAPKYLSPEIVNQILKAIDAGQLETILDGYQIKDWAYTEAALRSRGYTVQSVQTGMNETGLKVKWGLTDSEITKAYYEK